MQVKNSVFNHGLNTTADNGVSRSRSETGSNGLLDTKVSSSWAERGPDSPADVEFNKSLFAQGWDENVMTTNEERIFMQSSGC